MKYRPDSAEHAATAAICLLLAFVLTLLALAFAPHADGSSPDPQVARLRREVARQHARGDAWKWRYLETKRYWTRSDLKWAVSHAALDSDLPLADRKWLRAAAADIVFDGARESGGDTKAGNGEHAGLMQFNAAWGSRAKRESGRWCAYRFVRVYREGGRAAVERHWRATLYR